MIKCPKCNKTELREEVNLVGVIFARKKRLIFYCPLCDYKNVRTFDLKEEEYQAEMDKKRGNL